MGTTKELVVAFVTGRAGSAIEFRILGATEETCDSGLSLGVTIVDPDE